MDGTMQDLMSCCVGPVRLWRNRPIISHADGDFNYSQFAEKNLGAAERTQIVPGLFDFVSLN